MHWWCRSSRWRSYVRSTRVNNTHNQLKSAQRRFILALVEIIYRHRHRHRHSSLVTRQTWRLHRGVSHVERIATSTRRRKLALRRGKAFYFEGLRARARRNARCRYYQPGRMHYAARLFEVRPFRPFSRRFFRFALLSLLLLSLSLSFPSTCRFYALFVDAKCCTRDYIAGEMLLARFAVARTSRGGYFAIQRETFHGEVDWLFGLAELRDANNTRPLICASASMKGWKSHYFNRLWDNKKIVVTVLLRSSLSATARAFLFVFLSGAF